MIRRALPQTLTSGPLVALALAAGALACGDADRAGASAQEPTGQQPPRRAAGAVPAAAVPCRLVAGKDLPGEVPESSGLARSLRDTALFWTHNDAGNDPELFAVDASGRLVQTVRVAGAELVDWEDIEAGPCDGRGCLFVGDIGDNDAERDRITVYRIPEPASGATTSEAARALHARYPDGPRDAEALFLDGDGTLHVVTKGRRGSITLYRWPDPASGGGTATLQRVRELFPEPENGDDRVTAATATPDGRWVGIRSYRTLYLFPADQLLGPGEVSPHVVDLSPYGQSQGEALAMADDGTVWIGSEAQDEGVPRWARLACTFPDR